MPLYLSDFGTHTTVYYIIRDFVSRRQEKWFREVMQASILDSQRFGPHLWDLEMTWRQFRVDVQFHEEQTNQWMQTIWEQWYLEQPWGNYDSSEYGDPSSDDKGYQLYRPRERAWSSQDS